VRAASELPPLAGVETATPSNSALRLGLAPHADPQDILRQLLDHNIPVEQFEIATPTLDEIFIQVVKATQIGT
jgi:ABC-2 type transport system ATP-binding protein